MYCSLYVTHWNLCSVHPSEEPPIQWKVYTGIFRDDSVRLGFTIHKWDNANRFAKIKYPIFQAQVW